MLTQLKNLSKEELRKRVRTWIAYCLIAMVIVLSVAVVVSLARQYYQSKKIDALQQQMAAAEEANKSLAETVNNIRELRKIDAEVLSSLSDRLGGAMQRDSDLRNKLQLLETTNESARAYLDAPIHPDVARLLQTGEDGAHRADAAAAADGGVRGSGAQETGSKPRPRE